jgi:uncharacterized membrane protein HdeD (DUF308 family)
MSVIAAPFTRTLSRKLLAPWWLFLLTGIGWMLVALIVLRFDYKSVNAIAILFGIVAIAAGVLEIGIRWASDASMFVKAPAALPVRVVGRGCGRGSA